MLPPVGMESGALVYRPGCADSGMLKTGVSFDGLVPPERYFYCVFIARTEIRLCFLAGPDSVIDPLRSRRQL